MVGVYTPILLRRTTAARKPAERPATLRAHRNLDIRLESSEIEDLFPGHFLAGEVDRLLRQANAEFRDVVRPAAPVVPKIEARAKRQGIVLERDWKVELAKRVKKTLMTGSWQPGTEVLDLWQRVFQAFEAI